MKKLFMIILLVLVIFLSGCINLPNGENNDNGDADDNGDIVLLAGYTGVASNGASAVGGEINRVGQTFNINPNGIEYRIEYLIIKASRDGTGGTFRCKLYIADDSFPGTLIDTASINANNVKTTKNDIIFYFANKAQLQSDTEYVFTIESNSDTYCWVSYTQNCPSCYPNGIMIHDVGDFGWQTEPNNDLYFKIYASII